MILDLTNQLRNRINDYKKSNLYSEYSINRQNIRMIEIMINLTELCCENKFKLEKSNYYWFTGSYLINVDFNGEWKDISNLYSAIVDIMVNNKHVII